MKILIALVFALGLALPASAQNVKNPWHVSFCWDGKDDGGTALAVGTTVQVQVKVDGVTQPLVALPVSSGQGSCAVGSSAYTVSGFSASKSTHAAVGALVTTDGSGIDSDPFTFSVVGRPPSKLSVFQVVQ